MSPEIFDIQRARREVLTQKGILQPRKKYPNAEERKKAAAKRRKERRERERVALEPYGLAPRKRVKRSPTEKKAVRRKRSAKQRDFMRWAVGQHPEKAEEFGLDVRRFQMWADKKNKKSK